MSGGYSKGGRSLFFAERVGSGGKVSGTFEVLIEREATLTENLAEIETRHLRSITVLIHPGFEDVRVVRLDREDAAKLRDLLAASLDRAGEDA